MTNDHNSWLVILIGTTFSLRFGKLEKGKFTELPKLELQRHLPLGPYFTYDVSVCVSVTKWYCMYPGGVGAFDILQVI